MRMLILGAVSAADVGDSVRQLSALVRRVVRTANVGVAYRDLEAALRPDPYERHTVMIG